MENYRKPYDIAVKSYSEKPAGEPLSWLWKQWLSWYQWCLWRGLSDEENGRRRRPSVCLLFCEAGRSTRILATYDACEGRAYVTEKAEGKRDLYETVWKYENICEEICIEKALMKKVYSSYGREALSMENVYGEKVYSVRRKTWWNYYWWKWWWKWSDWTADYINMSSSEKWKW